MPANHKKHKILIADDDQDFVGLLRERLESVGYDTVCAYESVRAVELAHKGHPDLILLDWKMPTGRGGTVLEALALKDDTRKIPVIIVTGVDEPGMYEKSKTYGVKKIVRKPYDFNELHQKIREALEWKEFEEKL